jgi:hypothetical protein
MSPGNIKKIMFLRSKMGLERVPLSLVTTIAELLERKSSGSGLEIREYGLRDLPH